MAPASAAELYDTDGITLRWDNTLRYSAGFRMGSADPITLSYPNSDDGDRNFAAGLMESRFDLISVLEAKGEDFGAAASLLAWYDTVYFQRTDNTSPATSNIPSVPATSFSHATRHLDGARAELGDAFVYGNLSPGGMPLTLRLGRQTLLWGESLFFDNNGISAGMAPVDYIKSTSAPDSYSRDSFLPVSQISATLQPDEALSLSAYYQLEWRPSRLPAVGSYFSTNDMVGAGSERAFLGGGQYLLHVADSKPPSGGQYGVSAHANFEDFDLGLYALRFTSKYPMLYAEAGTGAPGYAGSYRSVYPTGIELYGASTSFYLGDVNVAGEISARRHMPLASTMPASPYVLTPLRLTGYAEGDTLHAQLSASATIGPGPLFDSADLSAEIAANDVLAVTANPAALASGHQRFAAGFRVLLQPHYFQVLPNLDLSPSLGVGVNATGRSTVDYTQQSQTGDFEIGMGATWRSVWKTSLTYTGFWGDAFRQPLTDRSYLLLSLERSF